MKKCISPQIFGIYPNINLTKMYPVGAELFHAYRKTNKQTDRRDKTNSAFRNYMDIPTN